MLDFLITLDSQDGTPLYEQLALALRRAIEDGRLEAGIAMPSSRELATRLGVSRSTVIKSFELLASQGYLVSNPAKGTQVSAHLPGESAEAPVLRKPAPVILPAESVVSDFSRRVLDLEDLNLLPYLNYLAPTEERTPLSEWRRLLRRTCTAGDIAVDGYFQEPFGYGPLRAVLTKYLKRSWSMNCEPEQIAIFNSPMTALDLFCRLILNDGDTVVVGNPGIRRAPRLLNAHGLRLRAVDMDEDGLRVEDLAAITEPVKLVYLTPTHQLPTGVLMSLSRRKALLSWSYETGALIVEDDYGSQFTPDSRRLATLQGLDNGQSVFYLSSLWEFLFPLVQFCFVVIPKRFTSAFSKAMQTLEMSVSIVEQAALAEFIDLGYLERLIRKNRLEFPVRRQALTTALIKHFQNRIWVKKEGSATSVLVRFRDGIADSEIKREAERVELPLVSTAPYYIRQPISGEYMIPLGPINTEDVDQKVERLAAAMRALD